MTHIWCTLFESETEYTNISENRDFIALEQIQGINPDQYKKEINQINDVIERLVTKYDYSKNGAIELIKFIIKPVLKI